MQHSLIRRFQSVLPLLLALLLLWQAVWIGGTLPAAAADSSTENAVDIALPDVSDDTALVWYQMDDPVGSTTMYTTNTVARDTIALSGTFLPEGGRYGGCLSFNGTSDYVQVNNDNIGETGFLHGSYAAESVSLWVKPASLSGTQMIFKQGGDLNGLAIRIQEGQLQCAVATDNTVNQPAGFPLTQDDLGRWIHVLVAFDGANKTLTLYVDGAAVSSCATAGSVIAPAKRGASLGRNMFDTNAFHQGGTDQYFSGCLDDFRVYRQVVTPQRILQSFDLPLETVPLGTSADDLRLPETVTVTLTADGSKTAELPVTGWEWGAAFSGSTPGLYTAYATLETGSGYSNANFLTPGYSVLVQDAQNSLNPLLYQAAAQVSAAIDRILVSNATTAQAILETAAAATDLDVSWKTQPVLTPATDSANGSIRGTLQVLADGQYLPVEVDLGILQTCQLEGAISLQSSLHKNYYLYPEHGSLLAGYAIRSSKRSWNMTVGLTGTGVSFRYGETDAYLQLRDGALTVAPAVTPTQMQNATFLEEEPLGAIPGWANVYAGSFHSYRLAGTQLYLQIREDDSVTLAEVDTANAADTGAATLKKTGNQTATQLENMRGAVYYPSYASNAYQTWKYYDHDIIDRELSYAQQANINALRVWVSYEYWLENPDHFHSAYTDFLSLTDARGIQVMPALFDGCGAEFGNNDSRAYTDVCITSPSSAIYNDSSRWGEPLAFVTDFMTRYKDDTRQFAIEIYNEPWGQARTDCAVYLLEQAVSMQGCVALSIGTAPSDIFNCERSVALGCDIIQYHDNFPGSTASFYSNALNKISLGQATNLPVYCTEVQWVNGPKNVSLADYVELAQTCNRLSAEYDWAPFYWSLMVHTAYLPENRQYGLTNGIFQQDGSLYSLANTQAIAPEVDWSGAAVSTATPYQQFYYETAWSEDFSDAAGNKWTVLSGSWSYRDGALLIPTKATGLADLTRFSDFGATFRLSGTAGPAGLLLRADAAGNGYLAGLDENGNLILATLTDGQYTLLASEKLPAGSGDTIGVYLMEDTITAVCGDTRVTVTDTTYTTGAIGFYAAAGAVVDDIHADAAWTELPLPAPEPEPTPDPDPDPYPDPEPDLERLPGDMNADGNRSVTDVVLLRKAILSGGFDAIGDMNGDGSLSVTDVVLLRKVILQQS